MSVIRESRERLRRLEEARRVPPIADAAALPVTAPLRVTIKWDTPYSRTGKRYNGHIWTKAGAQGDAVQFRFLNDPGTDDLLEANDYVRAEPIDEWDDDNACWSGDDAKYWATLSPYGMVP